MTKKVGPVRKLWRFCLSIYYAALHNPRIIDIYKRILKALPIRNNKIVMDNYNGLGYGENPKYIAEEFLERDARVKIIWLTNDTESAYPAGIKPVLKDSFRAYYETATAKAWVFNTRDNKLLEKRNGQVFLQTWHGGVALKKVEKDAQDKLTERYVLAAKQDGEEADGIIVDGTLNEGIFESSFWLNPNCELLKIGQPRVDVLIRERDNREIKNTVRRALGISEDSFFVLYAPTFRKTDYFNAYISDYTRLMEALNERFGRTEIALRLHPTAAQQMKKSRSYYGASLVNATNYPDVQELVIAADCVITDYSSLAYDFAIIRKPVFLIMKDAEEYKKERGVYDVFYDQPFRMNYNEVALAEEIRSFSYDEMNRRMDAFYKQYPTYNQGNASTQAVNWLIGKGVCATK